LPKGRYIIKSPLTWKTKVSMYGDGMGISVIASVGTIFSAIKNTLQGNSAGTTENVQPLEDVTFADFEIDCSGLTHAEASVEGKGFFILYMLRARFLNVYVHDSIGTGIGCDFLVDTLMHGCVVERAGRNWGLGSGAPSGGGQSGIGVGTGWKDVESLTISDCYTKNCGNYGIFVETQQSDNQLRFPTGTRVVNCYSEGNRFNFGNKGSGGVLWAGCESRNSVDSGITLSQNARNDAIINCRVINSGNHGIEVNNYFGGLLVDASTTIKDSVKDGIYISSEGSGDKAKDFHINNCVITDNGRSGILFSGTGRGISDYSVKNCTIRDNGTALVSAQRAGISLFNTLSKGFIIGNYMQNTDGNTSQSQAINAKFHTINNLDVINNSVMGYAIDAVSVSGTAITLRGNTGYNNKAYADNVSVSASPWVYTASMTDEMLYLTGTAIKIKVGGQVLLEDVTNTNVLVPANESIEIAYTGSIVAKKIRM